MNFVKNLSIQISVIIFIVFVSSCTKESTVESEIIPVEDSLISIAKTWFQHGARGATVNSTIDFRNLQPNWTNYRISHNAAGQPWISVRLKNNSGNVAYLTEMSIVVGKDGVPYGIIKEFARNPYKRDSPLTIYTIDGKVYLEGMYIRDKRVLRVNSSSQIGYRLSASLIDGTENRAVLKRANDPIRDIDEVVIMPPEQGEGDADGDGDGDDYNWNPGGGGVGGNGGNVPAAPPEGDPEDDAEGGAGGGEGEVEILDSLQGYPCAQNILNQLPNLKNQISQWLVNEFGGQENDLVFRAVTTLPDNLDGYWNTNNQIGTMQTITLNGNMLNTASKEYILVTMYHEALHAYIYLEKTRLSPELFFAKYSEWSEINLQGVPKYVTTHSQFKNLMTHLVSAIKEYNPNISDYDAEVLAKTGVVTSMSNLDINLNKSYKDGNSGTKCPN
ncbi:hypothetical protein [Sphingobacterium corticibacter]|uniref:SprT-like domain-containing protein n=1 Tax=Sphingobacterium corticibacter TaxID=2171749 RepID=A0A2T8HK48_9SPHI|nr:hypothetical protein [Sphingobacterium corticibacter]PVH25775.1 hypothetical protein DC487_07525 [Sphingobacterium corticibacter]